MRKSCDVFTLIFVENVGCIFSLFSILQLFFYEITNIAWVLKSLSCYKITFPHMSGFNESVSSIITEMSIDRYYSVVNWFPRERFYFSLYSLFRVTFRCSSYLDSCLSCGRRTTYQCTPLPFTGVENVQRARCQVLSPTAWN